MLPETNKVVGFFGGGRGGFIFFASVQNLEEKEKEEEDRREGCLCVCVCVCVCVPVCKKKSGPLVNGVIHHSLVGIGLGV